MEHNFQDIRMIWETILNGVVQGLGLAFIGLGLFYFVYFLVDVVYGIIRRQKRENSET